MVPRAFVVTVAVLGAALFLLAAGCKKGAHPGEDEALMPPPVSQAEQERGALACRAYVERVCACAKAKPDSAELQEQCALAPAKVSSLDMVLEVNRAPKDHKERAFTQRTAGRIVSSCIEEQSKLDSRGCPRPAPRSITSDQSAGE
jgi:hypothetical protein